MRTNDNNSPAAKALPISDNGAKSSLDLRALDALLKPLTGPDAARRIEHSFRELSMDNEDFGFIVRLIKERAGIALGPHKRSMVYSRLFRRVRELGLNNFREYRERLQGPGGEAETGLLVNALTTNYTKFFRESHHFDHLAVECIPAILKTAARTGQRRLRIWSAGCATGEEAYSIAMVLRQNFPDIGGWDVRILATDIDTSVLDAGAAGIYNAKLMPDIPATMRDKFMRPYDQVGQQYRVIGALRSLVTFKYLNLMDEWPMKGKFDAIFCRNVIIYFDRKGQESVIRRFGDALASHGNLYLGHSESPIWDLGALKLVGRSIYRKVT